MTDEDLASQLGNARIYTAELERALDAYRRRALELEAWQGDRIAGPPKNIGEAVSARVEEKAQARDATTVSLVFEELRVLQTQYLEADAVIGDLVRTSAERLADIEAKDREIASLTESIATLRSQLAERGALIESLSASADALRAQLEAKEAAREKLAAELPARQTVIDELVAANARTQRELEERDAVIRSLQDTCDERLRLLEEATADAQKSGGASTGLHEQLEAKEAEIRRLAAELANRQELLERLAIPEGR